MREQWLVISLHISGWAQDAKYILTLRNRKIVCETEIVSLGERLTHAWLIVMSDYDSTLSGYVWYFLFFRWKTKAYISMYVTVWKRSNNAMGMRQPHHGLGSGWTKEIEIGRRLYLPLSHKDRTYVLSSDNWVPRGRRIWRTSGELSSRFVLENTHIFSFKHRILKFLGLVLLFICAKTS